MRKKSLLLISLLAIAFSMNSCFNNLESHSTPQMLIGNFFVNPVFSGDTLVSVKDTLFITYNQDLGISCLDTVLLGDTIICTAEFASNMNNLLNINSSFDTTSVNLWFGVNMENEATKKILAESSQPERGILIFNPMYNHVIFPIYMVPQKVGAHTVKISVVSDSKYPTNSASLMLLVK